MLKAVGIEFQGGTEKSDCDLMCLLILHCKNKLDIAVGARPFVTLYFSSANCWIHFYHSPENDISFPQRVSNEEVYTVFINHSYNALSCRWFIYY